MSGVRYPTFEETATRRPTIVVPEFKVDKHRLVVRHVNIVITCTIGETINVVKLVEDNPHSFGRKTRASASVRLHAPETTCTLFLRGKKNIVGAKSDIEALVCAWTCALMIQTRGIPHAVVRDFTVHNLTASADMGYHIDVVRLVRENADFGCSANFELFPGARVKSPDTSLVVTVFRQGKVNVTGSRSIEETLDAYVVVQALLVKYFVFTEEDRARVKERLEALRKQGTLRAADVKRRQRLIDEAGGEDGDEGVAKDDDDMSEE